MPRIELIPVPLHKADDPYHYHYDNLPLENMMKRIELVNLSVDNVLNVLRESQGTQGTLANRLNQSINADGNLKEEAIDSSLHNIGSHSDGNYQGVDYVRMKLEERDKLNLVADQATSLFLTFPFGASTIDFNSDRLRFLNSQSITWEVITPNIIKAHMAFSPESAHLHYYDIEPSTTDYINFISPYPFIEDSLRVYINGVRINKRYEVYVPGAIISSPWSLTKFEETSNTSFALSRVISGDDIILIDFDINLV